MVDKKNKDLLKMSDFFLKFSYKTLIKKELKEEEKKRLFKLGDNLDKKLYNL